MTARWKAMGLCDGWVAVWGVGEKRPEGMSYIFTCCIQEALYYSQLGIWTGANLKSWMV